MPIQDQNRSKKTYSFFRAMPVPLPSTRDTDVIILPNIGALSAYDVSRLESGRLAFVKSVRDYFFLERTVNSGSTDSIQAVQASSFAGVWYRMGLGAPYWKNQLTWWIDAELGNDENVGAEDVPLRSMDELVRRLLNASKLRDDYVVTLTSVTRSIDNALGLDVEFDGGSVTVRGTPRFSASLGTVVGLFGAVDYVSASTPRIVFTGTGSLNGGPIYVSGSAGPDLIGWPLASEAGTLFTTPFTGAVGNQVYQASVPTLDTPGIVSRGRGALIMSGVHVGVANNQRLVICGDHASPVHLVVADVRSDSLELAGCHLVSDRSRVMSTSGSATMHHGAAVFGTGSGFVSQGQRFNIIDTVFEQGSCVLWGGEFIIAASRVTLTAPGASGSVLVSGSIEARFDTSIDVANLVSTRSMGSELKITGNNVAVFYNAMFPPKVNAVSINNGHEQNVLTSELPWHDMFRQVKVVSGSIASAGAW